MNETSNVHYAFSYYAFSYITLQGISISRDPKICIFLVHYIIYSVKNCPKYITTTKSNTTPIFISTLKAALLLRANTTTTYDPWPWIGLQQAPQKILLTYNLTHWGRVTHICVGNLTIIGPDNGLSPGQRQAIIWTNVGILLIGPWGTNFSEILIGIQTFSFKKVHLKMASAKWRPFCLGLHVLSRSWINVAHSFLMGWNTQ